MIWNAPPRKHRWPPGSFVELVLLAEPQRVKSHIKILGEWKYNGDIMGISSFSNGKILYKS
jgi:hypothetical protein